MNDSSGTARTRGTPPDPGDAPAYYVCIFAYETTPRTPQTSHTFATFVKASSETFEAHTISWLPQTSDVRLIRVSPEPGINHDLNSTLEIARAAGAQVYQWGPLQIKRELYERALRQIDRLNTGRVMYKAIDMGVRPDTAINCFHAVSDIDTDRGLLTTGTSYGVDATAKVVEHLSPWFVNREVRHLWINEKLGLDPSTLVAK